MECQFEVVVYLEHIVVLLGLSADQLDIEVVMEVVYLEHIVVLLGLSADQLDIEVLVASVVLLLHQFGVGRVLLPLSHHLK
jgi:hypothetical protein